MFDNKARRTKEMYLVLTVLKNRIRRKKYERSAVVVFLTFVNTQIVEPDRFNSTFNYSPVDPYYPDRNKLKQENTILAFMNHSVET
jgi:hypothetical protein